MPTKHEMILSETFRLSDHFSGTVIRDGKVIGFSESLRDGRAAHGDARNGAVDFGFTGPTSIGEEGTLEVGRVLTIVLNAADPGWIAPTALATEPHIDIYISNTDTARPPMAIQVVRAIVDPTHWKQIALLGGDNQVGVPVQELAAHMRRAIELKVSKIDEAVRPSLVLALNAIDTPAIAFGAVVEEFRTVFGNWAREQHFEAIWLVGPNLNLTHRLA
jgi:hypothetical protein